MKKLFLLLLAMLVIGCSVEQEAEAYDRHCWNTCQTQYKCVRQVRPLVFPRLYYKHKHGNWMGVRCVAQPVCQPTCCKPQPVCCPTPCDPCGGVIIEPPMEPVEPIEEPIVVEPEPMPEPGRPEKPERD